MDNPETSCDLDPALIYSYDTHRNIPWNDTEYQPNRQYLDPRKQISDRAYVNIKKGEKDTRYLTKRGFYMDYHIKIMKALPGAGTHNFKDPWSQEQNLKKSKFNKLDLSLSKYNYLDLIETAQKNRKIPGTGSYNLNKTQEQIDKELKQLSTKKRFIGNKHFFYEDTEYLSNLSPGAGSHNPHPDVPHLKINKTTHKLWIDKHKKEETKMQKRKSVQPAPGTHTPIPLEFNTFDRIKTAQLIRRKKKVVFHGFGSDAKFEYARPSKKKILEERPAPCAHNLVLEWKGKNMEVKSNNWIRSRSTGFSQSVYH